MEVGSKVLERLRVLPCVGTGGRAEGGEPTLNVWAFERLLGEDMLDGPGGGGGGPRGLSGPEVFDGDMGTGGIAPLPET